MNALWLQDTTLSLREVPIPRHADEALVRVHLSGICGTDLEMVRGYYPYTGVLGHEFVGEVVESPDSSWIGQRVVGEINLYCGVCEACVSGRPTHCPSRSVVGIANRDGSHAEYVSVPQSLLHAVPDSVSDDAAVFTEPIAAAAEILEQVEIGPGDRVLLVGAGRLGQLIAQVLATTGANLSVVARHDRQRELLASRGITSIREDDVEPRCWSIVVEATGSPSGFELALGAVRPRGTFVLKSTYAGEITCNLSPVVVDEITMIGSRCGPFGRALELLSSGAVDPTILIGERFPLSQALQAMEAASQPGAMKVLLDPTLVRN